MQLMNKATPEQLKQMLNVLNMNTTNQPHMSAHMAGKVQLPTSDSAFISHIGSVQLNEGKDLSSGKVKGIGDIEDVLYVLRMQGMQQRNVNTIRTIFVVGKTIDPALWHMRLGHIPMGVLRRIKAFNNCSSLTLKQCSICPQARQTRVPFPISNSKADANFDLVHMDVWGPYKMPTHNGKRYFLTLVDDNSRWTWVFLIALKSDVIVALKQFLSMIKTQFGRIVKVFRSDNGGEFFNTNCSELFTSNGILHQSSCPHTPQQNGIVERKHRHILETARAIKIQSNLLAHNIDYERGMHFLNLGGTKMPNHVESEILISSDHGEDEIPSIVVTGLSDGEPGPIEVTPPPPLCTLEEEHVEEEHVPDAQDHIGLRKSHRTARPPIWQTDYVLPGKATRNCLYSIGDVVDYASISVPYKSFLTKILQEQEPKTYHEAVQDNKRIEAIQSEIQALEENNT
ncbi:uncharacterized protein LOC125842960 [Solanum stenotomum]|uniref:uncharacterized protein LOC125842960 n=1 Tax=Solanum stenotomum TaxID=172797 RepID=UPI0020D17D4C|nr:uncharacterized protein LOC125842960 [Solanum stenotomum]